MHLWSQPWAFHAEGKYLQSEKLFLLSHQKVWNSKANFLVRGLKTSEIKGWDNRSEFQMCSAIQKMTPFVFMWSIGTFRKVFELCDWQMFHLAQVCYLIESLNNESCWCECPLVVEALGFICEDRICCVKRTKWINLHEDQQRDVYGRKASHSESKKKTRTIVKALKKKGSEICEEELYQAARQQTEHTAKKAQDFNRIRSGRF